MSTGVVITGAGVVSPLGVGCAANWDAVRAGKCGVRKLTAVESALEGERDGGQAPDLGEGAELPREVRYLRRAIAEAMEAAGIGDDELYPPHRRGILLGTTLHGMRAAGMFLRSGDFGVLGDFLAGATLANAAAPWQFEGFGATSCSACSSGLGAIALGVTLLQSGQLDVVLAGGYDTISEYAYGGFNSLRLVAEGPLKPFTRGRQGMKLAEGYGVVVLEREESARQRGARIEARIAGFGESADAHHLTQPHPGGEGAARAIRSALTSAGVSAQDIDLVCAHATGTPDNDAGEYAALAGVFGEGLARVPVVAFKSLMGHTLGGAGAVELILAMLAMKHQMVPSCANVKAEEVEFAGLNLSVGGAKTGKVRRTLNMSLGFGGANACMVLESGDEMWRRGDGGTGSARKEGVWITGFGVVLPGATGNEAFAQRWLAGDRGRRDVGAVKEEEIAHLLNSRRVRRMSEYVKLSLAATTLAMADAGITDVAGFASECCAILGTTHGSANYSEEYYRQIVREGIKAANPMLFAEGVPNAASAHLSLMLGIKGGCQSIIGTRTAGLDALGLAAQRIACGQWRRAIVSAAEEYAPLVNAGYEHCGLKSKGEAGMAFEDEKGFAVSAGAVCLILESGESMRQRGGRARGRVERYADGFGPPAQAGRRGERVLKELGATGLVLSSANATWVDRAELAAVRRAMGEGAVMATWSGRLGELFSAGPLIGLAGMLLTGSSGQQSEKDGGFVVLGTDYAGSVSGVSVRATRQNAK